MRIGIITTPEKNKSKISKALKEKNVKFEYINLLSDNWNHYFNGHFDGFLIYPPSFPDLWKNVFFERLFLFRDVLKGKSVPSLDSIMMYESKITMHDYYKVHEIPHVSSHTFFNYRNALSFAKTCSLPVVLKEDGGSGALGVKIVKKRRKLVNFIHKSFLINNKLRSYKGKKRIYKTLKNKVYPLKIFYDTNKQHLPIKNKTTGVVHIQSHLQVKYEWRIIRIGNSFFGHKKLEDKNGFHSGSLNKEWGEVSFSLLDSVKEWSDKLGLDSMCFDIFEDKSGNFYMNEMQVIFGTSTEAQLIINDTPGRYVYKNGWVFEEGDYARNGCNNLRIDLLLSKLK